MTVHERSVAMFERLKAELVRDLDGSVRWFHQRMPAAYFQFTGEDERARHLEILHQLRRSQDPRLVAMDDPGLGKLLVFGDPRRHTLEEVVALARARQVDQPIHRFELHVSSDRSAFIHAFVHGQGGPGASDLGALRQAVSAAVCGTKAECSLQVLRFLDSVDQGYLSRSSIDRVVRHIHAWSSLAHPEDSVVTVDQASAEEGGGRSTRLLLATGGGDMWPLLQHIALVLHRHRLGLVRGYGDWVPAVRGDHGRALIATVYAVDARGRPLTPRVAAAVADDLRAASRSVHDRLVTRYADGSLDLLTLELARALAELGATLVAGDHPYLDLHELAIDAVAAQPAVFAAIAALIPARFAPGVGRVSPAAWKRLHAHAGQLVAKIELRTHALVAEAALAAASAVQLTNAFRPGRLGLAFRLDPEVLPVARFPQRPYGVCWFRGANGRGCHIRFRASARGGLRVLLPRSPAHFARGREGLLQEVHDLAAAQQLKNKDIPEGGSKCICLVELGGDADLAVKELCDGLLDLILPHAKVPEVCGAHGADREGDLIFLGPDENLTPPRIAWIADRARERGLAHHATLISAKAGTGINHKEYGVTSEGLFTWIRQVLPVIGLDEQAHYTIKMTGGPDGDLGGNLIRIMHREHKSRSRIIAISDGTGAAHDPHGLDWDELLRLVQAGSGIANFDPRRLSSASEARACAANDRDGEAFRDTLYQRVEADLFVPCGGRPWTIDERSWNRFLRPDGRPSAKAMVEGANIFITASARAHLEDAGLVVIKDSSANKGGVICSSYEVLANLIMEPEEFTAAKARYVQEVIDIIRGRCSAEAKALLAAWRRRGGQPGHAGSVRLSELSARFSAEINRVAGLFEPLIAAHLDDRELAAVWRRQLEAHCPAAIAEMYQDRLITRIPRPHRIAILAKRLASQMVYREGLTWCSTYLQPERLWDTVRTYLTAETEVQALCDRLSRLKLPNAEVMLGVIAAGAQRELVRRGLGQEV